MAPPPDAAPAELIPTLAGHPGWCYSVDLADFSPAMMSQTSQLGSFEAPKYLYLDINQRHTQMEGGVSNGTETLAWADAREARWMTNRPYTNEPVPVGHAHWWGMPDATVRMGFAGGDQYWIGFNARRTPAGMDGVFHYWSLNAMEEAGEPAFEVAANMALVDCRETPMVAF